MKRKFGILLLLAIAFAMMFALSGCGGAQEESFSGTLSDANGDKIIVKSDSDVQVFNVTNQTVYEYAKDQNGLYIGDELKVDYHKKGKDQVADKVVVTEHQSDIAEQSTIKGEVTDLSDSSVMIVSGSLTAEFYYDNRTPIDGRLTEGDIVEITYYGNISENPYASKIHIVESKTDESIHVATGTVSEVHNDDVLISMDSAGGHHFVLTDDTIIKGQNKKLEIGDQVKVAYTGDIDDSPVARTITIEKKAEPEKKTHVIDGTIDKVQGQTLILNTGKQIYTFTLNEKTVYSGQAVPAKGLKTTITYTGDLKNRPVAEKVYCVKKKEIEKYTVTFVDGFGATLSKQTVEKGKAAVAPEKPTKKGYTFVGWDKDFKKVTSNMTITAKWKGDKPVPVQKFNVVFEDGQGNVLDKQVVEQGKDAKAPADPTRDGYIFDGWDKDFTNVQADLTVKACWVEKPQPVAEYTVTFEDGFGTVLDKQTVKEGEDAVAPEDPKKEGYTFQGWDKDFTKVMADLTVKATWKEDPTEPTEEPVTDPTETMTEPTEPPTEATEPPTEATQPPTEPPTEPPTKPTEPPAVYVNASGTITSWDGSSCTIKTDDGKTLNLGTKEVKTASGYSPQEGDQVKLSYEKNTMKLTELTLTGRPEPTE